jgi:hypothetical protein
VRINPAGQEPERLRARVAVGEGDADALARAVDVARRHAGRRAARLVVVAIAEPLERHQPAVGGDRRLERAVEAVDRARLRGAVADVGREVRQHAPVARQLVQPLAGRERDHRAVVGLRDVRVAARARDLHLAPSVRRRQPHIAALDVHDRVGRRRRGGDQRDSRGERRDRAGSHVRFLGVSMTGGPSSPRVGAATSACARDPFRPRSAPRTTQVVGRTRSVPRQGMTSWTPQQVLALAPDPAGAKAGQGLASPRPWSQLGHDDEAVWGLCQGSGRKPYQTQVDLSEPAFNCSCPSRKSPAGTRSGCCCCGSRATRCRAASGRTGCRSGRRCASGGPSEPPPAPTARPSRRILRRRRSGRCGASSACRAGLRSCGAGSSTCCGAGWPTHSASRGVLGRGGGADGRRAGARAGVARAPDELPRSPLGTG